MRSLEALAADAIDGRLSRTSPRPIAVALSGGGDSLALTLIADAWARRVDRDLLVLTVDHGLQTASADWAAACRATAERLGRPFRILAWSGDKPSTGLPAAARAARHQLLADAARAAGAGVILMGHTADDILEAQAMRAAGATTPSPREWSPSPAWPQGRGIFLLRPLLGVRRADLREWLRARGESWIDDPANADMTYARSRARAALVSGEPCRADPPRIRLATRTTEAMGVLETPRRDVLRAAPQDLARYLAIACVCAGGGSRRPAGARLGRLVAALQASGPVTATLAGARVEADDTVLRICREVGEAGRGGLAGEVLLPGIAAVWDGRFEIVTDISGLRIERLAGRTRQLSREARNRLAMLPAAARGAMPAVIDCRHVRCPLLEDTPGVLISSLVGQRLRAASGLVDREGS